MSPSVTAADDNGYSAYSQEIVDLDRRHVFHPIHAFDIINTEGALPIDRAEGVYIYDTEGKRYLDAVGGMWCTNIGTGRQEMADAIIEAMG